MKDLLGEALLQFRNDKKPEIFIERDDGFIAREKIERYFYTYEKWPEAERKILDSIKGPVLEIGCNIGMHLKYLKEKRGLEVFGIDISEGAVKIARSLGLNCSVIDARKIKPEKFKTKFKTVLILYYGLGLAGTIEDEKKMFESLRLITVKDAKLIGSSIDALKTDDPRHKAYQEFNKRKGKAYGNITQVTLRLRMNEVGDWYNLLFINPKGAEFLAEQSGWKLVKAIPENEKKDRWYYVFEKR